MPTSAAETQFKAKYPNARHTRQYGAFGYRYTVYAGEYLCSEAGSKREAYRLALAWEEQRFIQPDPDERPSKATIRERAAELAQYFKAKARRTGKTPEAELKQYFRGKLNEADLITQIEQLLKPIKCDQCQALMIQGIFCHETGCPNQNSRYDADSEIWIKQRTCFICGCDVDKDDPCCYAEPEPDEEPEEDE